MTKVHILQSSVQVAELSEGDTGGVKHASAAITGSSVYRMLKFESGVHRVQRVPATETAGRIHTSAATVVVLPQADAVCLIRVQGWQLAKPAHA